MADFNKNMLSPVGFSFSIKRSPGMNFFVQRANIPGITTGSPEIPTPLKAIPVYGDHLVYEELQIGFKVNEDLSNYRELHDWLVAITFPDNFGQHQNIATAETFTGEGIYSDGTLMILSSAMNPIIQVNFRDLIPISLSSLDFNTADTGIDYIEATASFKYTGYTFTTLE